MLSLEGTNMGLEVLIRAYQSRLDSVIISGKRLGLV